MVADDIPLKKIHHVEFWVGNAKQAAFYYRKAFGFSQTAYAGPETGLRDRASYVLEQGKIRFVLTTPLSPEGKLAEHIKAHGDGVKDIAFLVEDAGACWKSATERGAESALTPTEVSDANGAIQRAAIRTYGDTIHSFISYDDYQGPFLPHYEPALIQGESTGLVFPDHIVGNVGWNEMEQTAEFYRRVLGFDQLIHFTDDDITTQYSALMSKVMQNSTGKIKFPINEPAKGLKKSQIEEYIDFYQGPGVQHVALLTGNIIDTCTKLRANGVEFLEVPDTYYEALTDRVGLIDEDLATLRRLRILVDRDEDGYLLQLFSKPVEDRPTLFYEIIQRKGSQGFGQGNFQALFESIEREQARRGNL